LVPDFDVVERGTGPCSLGEDDIGSLNRPGFAGGCLV
jgi:hypothetical protein